MTIFKTITSAAIVAVGLLAASPASAVIITFATATPTSNNNMAWRNNGGNGSNISWADNGSGGTLYTTVSAPTVRADLTVPGAVMTKFTFLNGLLVPYFSNVDAWFTFSAAVVGHAAVTSLGGLVIGQPGLTGSFSFLSAAAIPIDSTTSFAAGANLLSGNFSNLFMAGLRGNTNAQAAGNTIGGATITFTSDFLDFSGTSDRDISLGLFGLISRFNNNNGVGFSAVQNSAVRSFRAVGQSLYSTADAPLINAATKSALRIGQGAVPEPNVWAMLLIGFGLVGSGMRRRSRAVAC